MACMVNAGEACMLHQVWSCMCTTMHVTGTATWVIMQANWTSFLHLHENLEFIQLGRLHALQRALELWDNSAATLAFLSAFA